jgi:peptidylprolyl isomerase
MKYYSSWMKNTLILLVAAMAAILVVVSAGCITPSTGNSASAATPAVTAEKNGSGLPARPSYLPAAPLWVPGSSAGETGNRQVATTGDSVSVYYTGTFENGTVFDSNMNATSPVVFTLGNSSVIPGFEEAVTGMSLNQVKTVNIPAGKAYGAYNSSLIRTVNRTGPIANTTFTQGEYYYIHDKTTNAVSIVKILQVNPDTVTWDANDPLAGLNFTFTIKLTGIRRQ